MFGTGSFSDRAPEIRAIVCMEQQQAYMMEINMYQCCKYKLDLPVITLPFIFVMSINSSHDVVSDRAGTIS